MLRERMFKWYSSGIGYEMLTSLILRSIRFFDRIFRSSYKGTTLDISYRYLLLHDSVATV